MRRFHNLETTSTLSIHPACEVGDALGQHPARMFEPLANRPGIAIFEVFDDHEQHYWECTEKLAQLPPRRRVDFGGSHSATEGGSEILPALRKMGAWPVTSVPASSH